MALPNFLIIGAPKSGTTSLHKYLSQHPQIFMSTPKEPHFFAYEGKRPDFCGPGDESAGTNRESIVDIDRYQALFQTAQNATALGEASTMYLYWSESTAARIHHYIPHVKLIAILRHPVDRAYSHYLHLRDEGREWLGDFRSALEAESERIKQHYAPAWHYAGVSRYGHQVGTFLKLFDSSQIKVYLYEDFLRSPQTVLADILNFLDVDADYALDISTKYNVSKTVRKRQWLHRFLIDENPAKALMRHWIPPALRKPAATYLYKSNIKAAPRLDPQLRDELTPLFREDILELQTLLDRDLSAWLATP